LETEARKRDKKNKFKNIRDKLKAKGFEARVDLKDKESVATYLNEEFRVFADRITAEREKQMKAFTDAKHLRRKQARQEKSELRKKGDLKGFEKGNPDFSDSDLPKITITQEEVDSVKAVLNTNPEEDSDGGPTPSGDLFTSDNIGTHSD
jgi:flagellar biosynthesis/type III secretory pathway protein FliH